LPATRTVLLSIALAVAVAVTGSGCSEGMQLDIFDLEVKPNPAQAGEDIAFEFFLIVMPARSIRLSAVVDGVTYAMETRSFNVNARFEWPLGDAVDMIAEYGAGTHTAQVLLLDIEEGVQLGSEQVTFELVDAAE